MARCARWLFPEADSKEIRLLASEMQVTLPAARVLWNRGYRDPASADRFLRPQLEHLHDPLLLRDMDRAVDRLHRAIVEGEKILLYGDYDVDGTSSIVILKKALDLAGANVEFHVPHRLRDGYGMRADVIDRAAAEDVRLIISVDTGIRATAVVKHARTLGIDVIVTDHHLPDAELPPAVAVVNPNRLDCTYPEKNLCGAGVTFKLVQALLARLTWEPARVRRMTESFLKLVALATVADVVPLAGENRAIVWLGLSSFHTVRNAGLRALLRVAGFNDGDCPSAQQVAFRIAPRINAAGRMASADDVIEMFLTDREERALELATQLHELNKERRQTETDIVQAIVDECTRMPVTDENAGLVFCGKEWHRGVVGIVASRVVERFHRPAFVLSEEDGIVSGSGRSIATFHLLEALESMPELFVKFGGHKQAAGVTLDVARMDEFRRRFNAWAAAQLSPDDFRPTVEIDATLELRELNDASAGQVLTLAPFGCGNPSPLFAAMDVEVCGPVAPIGERHLRIPVRQNGRTMMLKAWGFAERADEFGPGARLDVALCVDEDTYSLARGYPGWQVVLKEARPAAATRTVAA